MKARDSRLDKDFVLNNIGTNELEAQIMIFEKYLNISGINTLVNNKILFCNPLRKDSFPTCSFKIYLTKYGYKLWFRDWAEIKGYDCFDLVQSMANCSFSDCLELICLHFDLLSVERKLELKYVMTPTTILELNKKESKPIDIRIKTLPWTKTHLDYWKQYHLKLEDLEDDVVPIKCYWINGIKYNVPKNIGFAYCFGGYDYKIYCPFADKVKGELKFIHGKADVLQGALKLKCDKSNLIITSSYKDVKVLRKIQRQYNLDYEVIAPMSETTSILPEKIQKLKERYELLILYHNNDKAGIQSAITQSELYNCIYIHNPIGLPKDPSDLAKEKGLEHLAYIVKNLLYHAIAPF